MLLLFWRRDLFGRVCYSGDQGKSFSFLKWRFIGYYSIFHFYKIASLVRGFTPILRGSFLLEIFLPLFYGVAGISCTREQVYLDSIEGSAIPLKRTVGVT